MGGSAGIVPGWLPEAVPCSPEVLFSAQRYVTLEHVKWLLSPEMRGAERVEKREEKEIVLPLLEHLDSLLGTTQLSSLAGAENGTKKTVLPSN